MIWPAMARALVLQFIAGYEHAPATITLDLDHTDDATYGQQALSFYNHHYGHHCYLLSTVTARDGICCVDGQAA